VNDQDPRQVLARRLRALRERHWPGRKVNQSHLAAALGRAGNQPVSVPSISSWESRTNPKVPPAARLQDIATFFATPRSFDGQVGRLLNPDEMTVQEQAAREELLQELNRLRGEALNAPARPRPPAIIPSTDRDIAQSLDAGPYRFTDGYPVNIICAQLPQKQLDRMKPYSDPSDPDFIAMYRYTDLDALFELHGHLRAANPTTQVNLRLAHELQPDDYTGAHVVALGGVDWNQTTSRVLERLQLPVKQVSRLDEDEPGAAHFEVIGEDGRPVIHRPWLEESDGRSILREDVALFARAPSPFNRKRYVTICNGMFGSGTYGAVRALTDALFRDRNAEYLRVTFGDSDAFCILSRVTMENGKALTPDWTLPETRLFEWSSSR
jgi:hypothetical protein